MEAFDKEFDWESDDFDDNKLVTSDFPMPDGSKYYIEMSMLHWYWVHFIHKHTDMKLEEIAQDALDGKRKYPEGMSVDESIRYIIMVIAKQWVKSTTGQG